LRSTRASSALTPALPASILLWNSNATWQAPNTVPLASSRSIAMPSAGSTPAFGRRNGFLNAGALVSGSSILNASPILYLRHISSPSASGNASWRRTTTAVAATMFAVGGSLVARNVWANASGAPLLISYASTN
jgi:hypothetical protein